MNSLFTAVQEALTASEVTAKIRRTQALAAAWRAGVLTATPDTVAPTSSVGRPARPKLVHPRALARRSLHNAAGRLALIHAIAHIEFNAINLALDAVQRFRGLPPDYYGDWLRVAAEEASHFNLLRERLNALGHDYGDFPAHDGLWEMAQRTAHDVLVRMALVPRVLEARGLDVTPGMIARFNEAEDAATATILEVILRDEVEHVAIGSRWFKYLCRQRGLEPQETFTGLLAEYFRGPLRGPFNAEARLRAGFSVLELRQLEGLD